MDFTGNIFLPKKSSRSQMFFKKGVLKNFAMFTGKHLCWMESPLNKVAGLKACSFIKKRLHPTQVFFCEYCEIFKSSSFYKTPLVAVFTKICISNYFLNDAHREKQESARIQEFVSTESWLFLTELFDMLTQAIKYHKFYCLKFKRADVKLGEVIHKITSAFFFATTFTVYLRRF